MSTYEEAIAPRFDRGTQETRGHKKQRGPGTIEALLNKGRISGYELRAADEIISCFTYTTSPLVPKIMRYAPREDKGYSDQDPYWYRDAYVNRYTPFAMADPARFALLVRVLIEGFSFRDIAGPKTVARTNTAAAFISALREYATIAGWVDAGTLDDWRREEARAA